MTKYLTRFLNKPKISKNIITSYIYNGGNEVVSIEQAMTDYRRLGYSENWINKRIKSIEIRKELTNEWKRCGLEESVQFSTLTDIIYKIWRDHRAKEYKPLVSDRSTPYCRIEYLFEIS